MEWSPSITARDSSSKASDTDDTSSTIQVRWISAASLKNLKAFIKNSQKFQTINPTPDASTAIQSYLYVHQSAHRRHEKNHWTLHCNCHNSSAGVCKPSALCHGQGNPRSYWALSFWLFSNKLQFSSFALSIWSPVRPAHQASYQHCSFTRAASDRNRPSSSRRNASDANNSWSWYYVEWKPVSCFERAAPQVYNCRPCLQTITDISDAPSSAN